MRVILDEYPTLQYILLGVQILLISFYFSTLSEVVSLAFFMFGTRDNYKLTCMCIIGELIKNNKKLTISYIIYKVL